MKAYTCPEEMQAMWAGFTRALARAKMRATLSLITEYRHYAQNPV